MELQEDILVSIGHCWKYARDSIVGKMYKIGPVNILLVLLKKVHKCEAKQIINLMLSHHGNNLQLK